MSQQRLRARFSEMLLRLALGDAEAYQGLLGDLHEEADRVSKAKPGGRSKGAVDRLRHDYAVLALAGSYLLDRLRRRRHGGFSPRSRRSPRTGRRRPLASTSEDFRLAARLLRRRPMYAAAVIATLGLGFGAGAAVLSVAYGVWLRPLPFAAPDDLVRVYEVKLEGDEASLAGDAPFRPSALDAEIARRSRLSPPLLEDLRSTEWSSLVGMAAVSGISYDWEREGEAERLSAFRASRGVFEVLGLDAIEGRLFSEARGAREVVLGEGFWQRAFGGSPEVVGTRSLTLDGEQYLIVGVGGVLESPMTTLRRACAALGTSMSWVGSGLVQASPRHVPSSMPSLGLSVRTTRSIPIGAPRPCRYARTSYDRSWGSCNCCSRARSCSC
jgi:hypothetical protein